MFEGTCSHYFSSQFFSFFKPKFGVVIPMFRHLFGTLFSKTRFGRFRGSNLDPIWTHVGAIWFICCSFWVPMAPFVHPLGSILGPFGSFWATFWIHLAPLGSISVAQRPSCNVQRPILHVLAPSVSTLVNIFCILAPSKNKLTITSDK